MEWAGKKEQGRAVNDPRLLWHDGVFLARRGVSGADGAPRLPQFLADTYLTEEKIAAADALLPLAKELGCTPAQLALAWCAANPNVSTVLTGASRMEQVRAPLPPRFLFLRALSWRCVFGAGTRSLAAGVARHLLSRPSAETGAIAAGCRCTRTWARWRSCPSWTKR
jgi:hypothetical protein